MVPPRRGCFRLRKWYLDCVSERGDYVIAYAARLSLGPLSLPYAAVLSGSAENQSRSATSLTGSTRPRSEGPALTWSHRKLGIRGQWTPLAPPFRHTLLDTPDLCVEWRCHAPAAEGAVELAGTPLEGLGYAEELRMDGDPRKLPIRELRWGRLTGPRTSFVWIDWRGPHPLSLLLRDGALAEVTEVGDTHVALADARIELDPVRTIRDDEVGRSVAPKSPLLRALIPPSLRHMRETKWLSRGRAPGPDGSEVEGWAIHERVTWP